MPAAAAGPYRRTDLVLNADRRRTKDVDGFQHGPMSGLARPAGQTGRCVPCTPLGCLMLLAGSVGLACPAPGCGGGRSLEHRWQTDGAAPPEGQLHRDDRAFAHAKIWPGVCRQRGHLGGRSGSDRRWSPASSVQAGGDGDRCRHQPHPSARARDAGGPARPKPASSAMWPYARGGRRWRARSRRCRAGSGR